MKRVRYLMNVDNVKAFRSTIQKLTGNPSHTLLDMEKAKSLLITKANNLNASYKRFTGMDNIEYYQNRVIELQDQLTDAQKKRRHLSYMLQESRKHTMDIQEQLHKVRRYEEPTRFMDLMRLETEHIKRDGELNSELQLQEREERDIFSAFTNAIRDSQEKQAARMEYAKYIGFGLTVLGAIASYCITTLRSEDLKNVVRSAIKTDVQSVISMTVDKVLRDGASRKSEERALLTKISKQLSSSSSSSSWSSLFWAMTWPVTWMWGKTVGSKSSAPSSDKKANSESAIWWTLKTIAFPVTVSYSMARGVGSWVWSRCSWPPGS